MPDVMNAVFSYPKKGLTLTYDGTLKNGIYRENYIMGSEAAMYLDLGIKIFFCQQDLDFVVLDDLQDCQHRSYSTIQSIFAPDEDDIDFISGGIFEHCQ